ncbi:MAG: cell division protein FtsL [Peptococcaceae bacterium]|nr:cell division protein FtsL [Peptococcaceae bacterium]
MVVAQEKIQYEQVAYDLPIKGRVVTRKAHTTDTFRRAKVLAVSAVMLLFIAGIAVAAQYARLAVKNYNVTKLENAIAAQKLTNDQLQLEISELLSVSRIETIATKQLGMVKPDKYAYLDYQVKEKAKAPEVGAANQPAVVAQKAQGNPIIGQVADILSGIFGSQRR